MRTRPFILLILMLYILSPSLFSWMVNPHGAWYRPYTIWILVIVIAFVAQDRSQNNGL